MYNIYILRLISLSLNNRISSTDQSIDFKIKQLLSDKSNKIVQKKVLLYGIVFAFSWFFTLLKLLIQTITYEAYFSLLVLQVATLPLQGFLNALCYGGYFDYLLTHYFKLIISI